MLWAIIVESCFTLHTQFWHTKWDKCSILYFSRWSDVPTTNHEYFLKFGEIFGVIIVFSSDCKGSAYQLQIILKKIQYFTKGKNYNQETYMKWTSLVYLNLDFCYTMVIPTELKTPLTYSIFRFFSKFVVK